jgi:hypothetical protein
MGHERRRGGAMQRDPAVGRQRLLDGEAGESASSSQTSACGVAIAIASSRSRAGTESRARRARTASRTVCGISPVPAASTSVT